MSDATKDEQKPQRPNGAKLQGDSADEPPLGWVDRRDYLRLTGSTPKQVEHWITDKKIRCIVAKGKQWLDPDDVPDTLPTEKLTATSALVRQVQLATGHIERMYSLTHKTFEILSASHDKVQARAEKLDEELRLVRTQLDTVLSSQVERDMARLRFEAELRRNELALAKVLEFAPHVFSALAFKWAPGSRAVQEAQLSELVESIDIEKLKLAKEAGVLTDEQLVGIVNIRAKLKKQREEIQKSLTEARRDAGGSTPAAEEKK